MSAVQLGDIVEIKGGGTPNKGVDAYWGGDIPWASVKDFKSTEISRTVDKITQLGVENSATNIIPAGSILVPTRMAVGKVAINTVPMAINQDLKALKLKPCVDTRYLLHALMAKAPSLEEQATGATVKGITLDVLRSLLIPLPPLDEQKRIATILDQADELRRKRQRAINRLKQLGQAIFHEMFVTGKGEWPEKPLADVVTPATIVTYGIVQAGEECPGGIPYIRTGDIKDGKIALGGLRHTNPAIASKFERSRVRTGEIVMSIRATVGTVAFVPAELDGANLTQGTARISPGPAVKPWYLIEYLRSPAVQDWIEKQVKGATFREITLTRLREMTVVVPPKIMQNRFSEIMNHVDTQRAFAVDALRKTEAVFSALQSRAFRDEL